MTPAMKAWLTKLRDEGPQICVWSDTRSLDCRDARLTAVVIGDRGFVDVITPAGLAALADAERGKP